MEALLDQLSPNSLDIGGEIAATFFENPFLEANLPALAQRFGQAGNLAQVLGELTDAGVLCQLNGFYRLGADNQVYAHVQDWVRGQRGEDEKLRQEVVAFETLSRLREKLAVRQEEVSSILDMVPVGVILLDQLGQVLKANQMADRLTQGWGDVGGKLGLQLDVLLTQPFETELDEIPPVAVTTRPFRVAGSDTGVVVVIQDITAKREMAAQAEKMREDFFSMIRHELRKPLLTVERSLAQLGKAEGESPLALARSATDHLGAMIDDMLFLARLERDPLAVVMQDDVSVRFLLAGCDLAFRQKAKDTGVAFTVNFPDDDISVCADERRLQQVLGNLLDNAFKFVPPNGTVSLIGYFENDAVHLVVDDSGPGIPESEKGEVFGKFYQIQSDAARKPGLGLGLAISQEVVQAHGGEIRVEDSDWAGARMRVVLPVKKE